MASQPSLWTTFWLQRRAWCLIPYRMCFDGTQHPYGLSVALNLQTIMTADSCIITADSCIMTADS